MLSLYKFARTYGYDYDTYDSAVVLAHSEMQAREMLQKECNGDCKDDWENPSIWLGDCFACEYIGTVNGINLEPQILCASYNAG